MPAILLTRENIAGMAPSYSTKKPPEGGLKVEKCCQCILAWQRVITDNNPIREIVLSIRESEARIRKRLRKYLNVAIVFY